MPLVEWKPEYSVGIETIDNDHRQLFSLLNQVHLSQSGRQSHAALNHILGELDYYAQTHFREEEALMKRYGYPEFAAHRAMHDDFTAQVARLREHFQIGQEGVILEISATLQNWLAQHILQSDAAYATYFRMKDAAR